MILGVELPKVSIDMAFEAYVLDSDVCAQRFRDLIAMNWGTPRIPPYMFACPREIHLKEATYHGSVNKRAVQALCAGKWSLNSSIHYENLQSCMHKQTASHEKELLFIVRIMTLHLPSAGSQCGITRPSSPCWHRGLTETDPISTSLRIK